MSYRFLRCRRPQVYHLDRYLETMTNKSETDLPEVSSEATTNTFDNCKRTNILDDCKITLESETEESSDYKNMFRSNLFTLPLLDANGDLSMDDFCMKDVNQFIDFGGSNVKSKRMNGSIHYDNEIDNDTCTRTSVVHETKKSLLSSTPDVLLQYLFYRQPQVTHEQNEIQKRQQKQQTLQEDTTNINETFHQEQKIEVVQQQEEDTQKQHPPANIQQEEVVYQQQLKEADQNDFQQRQQQQHHSQDQEKLQLHHQQQLQLQLQQQQLQHQQLQLQLKLQHIQQEQQNQQLSQNHQYQHEHQQLQDQHMLQRCHQPKLDDKVSTETEKPAYIFIQERGDRVSINYETKRNRKKLSKKLSSKKPYRQNSSKIRLRSKSLTNVFNCNQDVGISDTSYVQSGDSKSNTLRSFSCPATASYNSKRNKRSSTPTIDLPQNYCFSPCFSPIPEIKESKKLHILEQHSKKCGSDVLHSSKMQVNYAFQQKQLQTEWQLQLIPEDSSN
eukprot:Awhi_evm1s10273